MDYDEKTLKQLRGADWNLLSVKLLKFAIALGGRSIIAKGMDTEDVVHEAIAKTFSGERKWNTKIPLLVHLKEAIRSMLSIKGLYGCADKTKRHPSPSEELEISPTESENRYTDKLVELKTKIKGNKDIESVLEAIIAGARTPREIARITELHPRVISEHKRTIKSNWIKINGGKQ